MPSESKKALPKWMKNRQVKIAFHLPTFSNPDHNERRFTLSKQIVNALSAIDDLFGPNKSSDGFWSRGSGVFRMIDGTDVNDPYIRYFIVLDPPWEQRIERLKEILEDFRTNSGDNKDGFAEQQSIYLEIQYCVDLVLVCQKQGAANGSS